MFEPTSTDIATKTAAIDWLLSIGECNEPHAWTESQLATLRHRGVDYERSDAPQHLIVEIESDEVGRVGERAGMLAATIVYADAVQPYGKFGPYEGVQFVVPEAAFAHQVMRLAIGAVDPTEDRRAAWEARAYTEHYDRLVAEAAKAEQREQARQAALAARVGRTVRSVHGDPGDASEYGIVASVAPNGRGYSVIWHGDVTGKFADADEVEFVDDGDVPQTFTRQ